MTKREIRQAVREVIVAHAENLIFHWDELNEDFEYGDPELITDEAASIAAEEMRRLHKFYGVWREDGVNAYAMSNLD